MGRKVSGEKLSEGRAEFQQGKRSIFEQLLARGKRVPAQGKETLSVVGILKSRVGYDKGLLEAFKKVSSKFEQGNVVTTGEELSL